MSLKREVSKSLADLQVTVKRLALDEETSFESKLSPLHTQSEFTSPQSSMLNPDNAEALSAPSSHLKTVLSSSRQDFDDCYVKLEEIGRGGFSVVHKCRNLQTNALFAVKVIDLRPLKLHERFNPSRLRREVDIMRRLRHPNIIQFVEVFENNDQLLVVMELAPGDELFDVILARQYFTEEDARPIFQQICSSLSYLHGLDIIHRDIKPENILFMHQKNPTSGLPMIKLLDFGLSKHAGMGSEAKTFVGTPCYLAPEVEFTAKGQGGTYGAPADCWSMGAVLYVMLVARFPEFHRHEDGSIELKLPAPLWGNKSKESRALVKGLMCYDPNKRLTAAQAMSHSWLGEFSVSPTYSFNVPPPLPPTGRSAFTSPSSRPEQQQRQQQLPPHTPSSVTSDSTTTPITGQSKGKGARSNSNDVLDMVLHPHHNADIQDQLSASKQHNYSCPSPDISINIPTYRPMQSTPYDGDNYALTTNNSHINISNHVSNLNLTPLLSLQRNIVSCFEEVQESYSKHPVLSTQVREAAVVCRSQLGESTKMLRKIEQTSLSVLNMFPDLELALEENEPALAGVFFDMVKSWISELVVSVSTTQQANRASISKIQNILEVSSQSVKVSSSPRLSNGDSVTVSMTDLQRTLMDLQDKQKSNTLNTTDFVALFSSLFERQAPVQAPPIAASASPKSDVNSGYSSDETDFVIGGKSVHSNSNNNGNSMPVCEEVGSMDLEVEESVTDVREFNVSDNPPPLSGECDNDLAIVTNYSPLTSSALSGQEQLGKALGILQQVDTILEQLGMFWGNTEVVLDVLSKKGQHAEQFIGFSHNPKLHQRFKERVGEYKLFWEGVMSMCSTYLMGIVEPQDTLSRFCTPPEEVPPSSEGSVASTVSSLSSSSSSTVPSTTRMKQHCHNAANPSTSTFMNSANGMFASSPAPPPPADDPF